MRKLISIILMVLALASCVNAQEDNELRLIGETDMGRLPVITKVSRDDEWTKMITYEAVREDPEPEMEYYGNCRITFYDSCVSCCGQWAGSPTASGEMPVAGWTVANGSLPFGTRVLINGHEYCVTDRGVGGNAFDIYVNNHGEIPSVGMYYTDVYILP